MKKIINKNAVISIALASFLFANTTGSQAVAGIVDTTKEYANKAMIWKDLHLQEVSFNEVYPKAIYKKSYFAWIVLGASIVAGGIFTACTYTFGAPAAATGVASVASWVGGGGAGSYMAGLSTVGGIVGGNAVTGSVILNGLSYGLIGGTMGKFGALSAASKFGVIVNVSTTMLDGVASIKNSEMGDPYFVVRFNIPKNLGGKLVRKLVDDYYNYQDELTESISNGNENGIKINTSLKQSVLNTSEDYLNNHLSDNTLSQEDLIVLSMLVYEKGNSILFQDTIKKLGSIIDSNRKNGYWDYLLAVNHLLDRDMDKAITALKSARSDNPYAIEPIILLNNLLATDFQKNESHIKFNVTYVEKMFDSDKYSSPYNLLALYYRMANIYYNNKDYKEAMNYFKKAKDEIGVIDGFLGGDKLKNQISLGIANCSYLCGDKATADKLFKELIEDADKDDIEEISAQFAGVSR